MSGKIIDFTTFRKVLGSYPTGVSVVTARAKDGTPVGMVVGTFTSVSLDPPLVGFLPDKKSQTWLLIAGAGRFCVNVLGSDQQQICRQISAKEPDKFAGIEHHISDHDLPVITDSIARIECNIHSINDAGDHWFVLGHVINLEIMQDKDPMLFHRGRYGGFSTLA